ncbi:amidase signature domain-containing protein [Ilyonectria sp. MPI-CAGE-AT-0026]|nr:amidase signature domain-containing protein [Ilyonectria sp. MPI-CAGE-AT-0026]
MAFHVDLLTLTAAELQSLLTDGATTSAKIVDLYLAQIEKHNHAGIKLHAIISVADRETLSARARQLDLERLQGKTRGPFHGVPIIIKDICTTVDMPTTCGSFAFAQGRAKEDAPIIKTLNDAGLIIIAKANLSELGNTKGDGLMAGWSAVGGQTQNPYVEGGVEEDGPFLTNSGPAGSSSGSAVGVAAGFAPVSLGTELDGSIAMPAARAGLYAIKLTPDSVDNTGFMPVCPGQDCQGPYARTTADVATLSAVIQLRDPDHYLPLRKSWEGLSVGFVDPKLWRSYPTVIEPVDGFFEQTDAALFTAQEKIQQLGGKVVKSVPLASWEDITGAMPDLVEMEDLFPYQLNRRFPGFLQMFDGIPQTLEGLIQFNEQHADIEFTKRNNNQKVLESARDTKITEEKYQTNFRALRGAAVSTLLAMMNGYEVDIILGPCDSRTASVGAAAGFPVGNLPLGHAFFNGRPFSLHVIAPPDEEGKIFQVMSAWETTFPENVRPPPQLVEK